MYLRIKKMSGKINGKMKSEIILVLLAVILSGCWQNGTTETAKTANVNQNTGQNINQAATTLNNNVAANSPNTSTSATVNNTSVPTVNGDKKSSPPVNAPTPQVGSSNDFSLFTQARVALNSDKEFIDTVIIEIKEGNVVLTGNVSSEAQKTKAGQLVQAVKGIKSVKNNLRVSS